MKKALSLPGQSKFPRFEVMGLNIGLNQTVKMELSHRHDEIELNFVESGAIAYSFAGKTTLVKISQLALFWAATPHRLVWAEPQTCLHWLTIPLPLFLQWGLPSALVKLVLQGEMVTNDSLLSTAQTEIYKYQFSQWNIDLHSPSHQEVPQRVVVLELQALLNRLAFRAVQTRFSSDYDLEQKVAVNKDNYPRLDKVEQIAQFIAENHGSPLSIEQIAGEVGLHPNYAMRVFKKVYGVSVLSYLTQHRLAHAQRLLATTDQPIVEIGFEVGFSSTTRFYTVFKAICKVTPLEYRKSLRN